MICLQDTLPVSTEAYRSTNRSVSLQDLVDRKLTTGVYTGTPYWKNVPIGLIKIFITP
jgi:hypothetical protein